MDMNQWRQVLAAADDDYLAGLCNKGTVKRAYKELEEAQTEIRQQEDGFEVQVGEEICRICLPLGDSKCSCISRSICKHIIIAVLRVREFVEGCAGEEADTESADVGQEESDAGKEPPDQGRAAGERAAEDQDILIDSGAAVRQNVSADNGVADGQSNSTGSGVTAVQDSLADSNVPAGQEKFTVENMSDSNNALDKDAASGGRDVAAVQNEPLSGNARNFPEISGFPLEKIKKAMGKRRYQKLISSVSLKLRPQIEITSVITVTFPDTGTKVKLLEPLAYSSCSCHKKELCSHKAEAILWYQLEQGILKPEQLQAAEDANADLNIDLDAIHGLAEAILQLLETALRTGLARTSPDMSDSLERMAILCHNQELADFERYSRSLRDSWQCYFNRMASFRAEELMSRMMMVYQKAQALREAENGEQVQKLAGQFRSEYRPAGELVLIGIGSRHFLSKTGYEGETCYFLEESTKKWYTYTNARPVFYEQSTRRRAGAYGKTPWELKASMQELTQLRIRLRNAKANDKRRLSSSGETQGEILGARNVKQSEVAECYYTDFQKLFREQIGNTAFSWAPEEEKEYGFDESRHPVLVQAAECGEGQFDEITQTFRMELRDGQGVVLTIEVAYSKEEDFTIRYLERVARRIQRDHRSVPCFVGDVYLEDGKMKLYPITFLEAKEIIEDEMPEVGAAGVARTTTRQSGTTGAIEAMKAGRAAGTGTSETAENIDIPENADTQETTVPPEAVEVIREFSDRITGVLADLFQSGFLTVHDSTLEELDAAVSRAEQYGMEALSAMLAELSAELKQQRHQVHGQSRKLYDVYGKLNQYLYLCRKRLEVDQAAALI